jgi:hypothetical protein
MNMYLKMAIACAVGALLALSLGKHVSDATPALVVWGAIGAFAGFVLCGPKKFFQSISVEWKDSQERRERLLEAERRQKREHHWLSKACALRKRLTRLDGWTLAIVLIYILALVLSFSALVLAREMGTLGLFSVYMKVLVSGALWLVIQFMEYDLQITNRLSVTTLMCIERGGGTAWYPVTTPLSRKEVVRALCKEIRSRKAISKRMCYAPFALLIFAWWAARHASELVLIVGIILARICRRVATLERWCSAVGALVGYVVGFSFGRSEVFTMFVGAGVGVGLRFAAKHLLPLLPDPDLCLFDAIWKSST